MSGNELNQEQAPVAIIEEMNLVLADAGDDYTNHIAAFLGLIDGAVNQAIFEADMAGIKGYECIGKGVRDIKGVEFQWARENSDNLQTGLTGGASRDSSVSLWKSEQWGRNVRIAGTCQSTCIVEGETKGSVSIIDGDYQLEASILDSEATDPVYFLGVYEGDVSGEVSVVVNEQDSSNVTLVLSAYNATTWNLSGNGLDNVTNIYVLGYQAGTVVGANQITTVISHSFDEDNYIGTLSEWPDMQSSELSEQEKQQSLTNIEAVTGTVTSYGVVYSTNGFEVY